MAKMYTEEEVKVERQKAALTTIFLNMRDEIVNQDRGGSYLWAVEWALLQLGIKVEDSDETQKTR